MRRSTKFALILLPLIILVGGWAAYYAQDKGFSHRWRNVVTSEFEKRGIHLTVRRLNLDPLRGLIAKDVLVYEDPDHEILLMQISQIALDVDMANIREKEVSLRAFEIRNAKVTLPLDPKRKLRGEQLRLNEFSARILMPEDQIEIVNGDAMIHGVAVSVTGSLFRPSQGSLENDHDSRHAAEQQIERLRLIRQQREWIAHVLQRLQAIEYEADAKPKLEIRIQGDTARLHAIKASGTLDCGPFRYQSFRAEALRAAFDFEKQRLVVHEMEVEDQDGKLRSEWEYDPGSKALRFQFTSSIDLIPLIAVANPSPRLHELVFYQPPRIEASGTYHFDRPFSWKKLPLDVIGEFRADRTTSRGVIFDAIGCNFSANEDQLFIRNGRVEHKSGVLACDLIKDSNGVRFRGDMRLHPTIFTPFLALEGSKQFIKRWTLTEESAVFVNIEGHGPTMSPLDWTTTGIVDLRKCRLNNHPIDHLQCDLYFDGKLRNYYNVVIRRPEGQVTGEHIQFDHEAQTCQFRNVRGRVFPVHAVGWFAPEAAQSLVVYDFEEPPELSVQGLLDTRPPSELQGEEARHDYSISFQSDSRAQYKLFGKTLLLEKPSGTVAIRGNDVFLDDFRAGVLDGNVRASVALTDIHREMGYHSEIEVDRVDFQKLVQTYGDSHDTSGVISGTATFSAAKPGIENLTAVGQAHIEDGDVFCIPAFGPLSKQVAAALPKVHAGFSVAREADLHFRVANGDFLTENFFATTKTFNLKGKGSIDLTSHELDFLATLNLKGPAGALLVPVSKLLEYRGEGSLSEPVWRPRNLPRLKETPIQDVTSTAAGALRKIGQSLPKRLPPVGEDNRPDKEPVKAPRPE